LSDFAGLLEDDAVWDEGGIDITGHPVGVVGQGHGGTADDEEVGNYATPHEPVPQGGERCLQLGAAEETVVTHAASRSRAER
jgi:hypothetical protein